LGGSAIARPSFEILLPPTDAVRCEGDRLGHLSVPYPPANRRFAQTGRRDHVVQAEEPAAGAGYAATFAARHCAIPCRGCVRGGHQRSPFEGLRRIGGMLEHARRDVVAAIDKIRISAVPASDRLGFDVLRQNIGGGRRGTGCRSFARHRTACPSSKRTEAKTWRTARTSHCLPVRPSPWNRARSPPQTPRSHTSQSHRRRHQIIPSAWR